MGLAAGAHVAAPFLIGVGDGLARSRSLRGEAARRDMARLSGAAAYSKNLLELGEVFAMKARRTKGWLVDDARRRRITAFRRFMRARRAGDADAMFTHALKLAETMRAEAEVFYASLWPCSTLVH